MRNSQAPHVVLTGGGTAGHLFPGLAVAEQLDRDVPGIKITFAGSGKQFEWQHVAAAGFEYVALRCRALPRRLRDLFSFLADNIAGYREARQLLRQERVDAVVGLGGFASAPMARAAVRCGIPLVLLEQNVVPGRATRWFAKAATCVCVAYEATGTYLPGQCKVRVTGNPLRQAFVDAAGAVSSPGPICKLPQRHLLVLGGSAGAQSLNEELPHALHRVQRLLGNWRILHQSGESHVTATQRLYDQLDLSAKVVPFFPDVAHVMARTDLAVCRAGGTTLAELSATGVPAVLVPYPHATDDHQRRNAEVADDVGGCVVVDPRRSTVPLHQRLSATLEPLLSGAGRRKTMSLAMRGLTRPAATSEVAALVAGLLTPTVTETPTESRPEAA